MFPLLAGVTSNNFCWLARSYLGLQAIAHWVQRHAGGLFFNQVFDRHYPGDRVVLGDSQMPDTFIFHKLIQNKEAHLSELDTILKEVERKIDGFYNGEDQMSILDIMLASHIWGMYVFPEFQFSPKLHDYLQRVKALCHFEYHEDFWSDSFNQ